MTKARDDWFITSSGKRFFALDPQPDAICVEDIAHALAQICRFGGHVLRFYSVAQHSVIVSQIVPPELAMHGLMHDAAEAYCGDVIRPIKRNLPGYGEIEAAIDEAVHRRFGLRALTLAEHQEIKRADNVALVTERRDLVAPHTYPWKEDERGYDPLALPIDPLCPRAARWLFLARFVELGG